MRQLILASLLVPMTLSAKESGVCAQKVAMDTKFSLKHGGCVLLAGKFEIRLIKISGDSRCPSDVQCGWAGDVTALFSVKQKGAAPASIHIGHHGGEGFAIYRKREIKLLDVAPYPLSTRDISQDEYTATLLVSTAK